MTMKYNTKLLLANCIPLIVFAIVSLIVGFTQFETSLYNEKQGRLKSAALAAWALYSSHGYGDYGLKVDGNVWRGMNFNVSTETFVVDDLRQETGVDITFFFEIPFEFNDEHLIKISLIICKLFFNEPISSINNLFSFILSFADFAKV